MKLTAKQINEIAQELEAGMKVYINRADLEIRTILDSDDMYGDTEFWDEELEKIENEWTDYIVLEKMASGEAFTIMEGFVEEVDNEKLQQDLIKILNRKSPFANFKAEVESSDYRQNWFNFRDQKYEEYVREQLEEENVEFE
jgi:hypothetical protein